MELIWKWKMLDCWKVKSKNEALIELESDRD